jgi:hypothetical protein
MSLAEGTLDFRPGRNLATHFDYRPANTSRVDYVEPWFITFAQAALHDLNAAEPWQDWQVQRHIHPASWTPQGEGAGRRALTDRAISS